MSTTYPQYPNSNFPDQIDSWLRRQDPNSSDMVLIRQFKAYLDVNDVTSAQNLINSNPSLLVKIFNADALNNIQDGLMALETFFKNNVDGYIQTKQTEMQSYIDNFTDKDIYSSTTPYVARNFVHYNNEVYIALKNNLNITPTDDKVNWSKLSIKGDQGIQGIPGVNVNFLYSEYDPSVVYNKNQALQYNGNLYACKNDNTVGILPTDTSSWSLVVSKGSSTTIAVLKNSVTITTNTSSVAIGLAGYNPTTDMLSVHFNNQYIEINYDYTISADGLNIITTGNNWDGTVNPIRFDFVAIKNVINGVSYADGSLIGDGTILISKLHSEIQTAINKVGTDTLNTTAQNLSGAINEVNDSLTNNVTDTMTLKQHTTVKSNKDAYGIYTTVQIKRADGTLYMQSVLSAGTAPQYTTRTETYYKTDGTTIDVTKTYTRAYDSDGDLLSEVIN